MRKPSFWKNLKIYRIGNRRTLPPLERVNTEGVYHLVLGLPEPRRLHVGSLGLQSFPAGIYIYTGRARRGFVSRLRRHLRRKKTNHWHIDRLTKVARLEEIWANSGAKIGECESHRSILSLPGANMPVSRFGSSDCRCYSHLARFNKMPNSTERGHRNGNKR